MKNFLIAVLAALCCLLLGAFCWGVPFKWPNRGPATEEEPLTKEWVRAEIAHQVEPTFDDVDALLHYQYLASHEASIDSEFLAMSPELLRQVGTVCINRDGYATKESVVLDFRSNAQIYNNLKSDATVTEVKEVTDHTSGGISYRQEGGSDTIIINGKPYINHGKENN